MAEAAEAPWDDDPIILGVIEGTLTLGTDDLALAEIAWKGFQFFANAAFARSHPEISKWVSLRFEVTSVERGSWKVNWKGYFTLPSGALDKIKKVPGQIGNAFSAIGNDIKKTGVTATVIAALGLGVAGYSVISVARDDTGKYCPQSSPTVTMTCDFRPPQPGEKCSKPFDGFKNIDPKKP